LKATDQCLVGNTFATDAEIGEMAMPLFKWSATSHHLCISGTVVPRRPCNHSKYAEWPHYGGGADNTFLCPKGSGFQDICKILISAWYALQFLQFV